ncbi:flagellar basal-body MS-ring/collar protein FliF [Methyloversatilis sp.]|uniref:flagellar basal-body MS-ring/collar protein FliF n=1 Tax=Methyloversatilis sp. TaxID=2569862 RepID=UPI002733EA42|nr:flagellar basal-body MS-ring/collar protein FliF [Methyloversatilis sp.]MDP3577820.1 flagellar basal-body MS-ring/collar protein FliF [Methyloversatilis sp.]
MAEAAAIPLNPTLGQRISTLNQGQIMRLAVGVALFVVIAIAGLMMGRQAEWRVLYANLSDKDGGAIIAQLSQLNIPYKHAEGGHAILVPADKVHDTRLRLASQGLPKGSVAGFELMEANRFGVTQFQERVSFQRGLEGELTRSIQALSSVQSARVHLAIPNQNGFFREQQKPTASVLLSLNAGRSLDRSQIAGIVHLVASSVPEMKPEAVSVLDDTGKLLSQSTSGPDGVAGGADAQQLQYVQQLETLYRQRILDILEPVVGRQNVKAQVTADVDFSQTEQTSETHKPNQTPESGSIRSQQLLESSNPGPAGPGGVPGAATNQPPGPNAAPINAPAQALAPGAPGAAAAATPPSTRRESIINYEVDKTVRVVRAGSGVVKRLSAAVVVNHKSEIDAKGKTITTPLTDQQIDRMTALVRETIGFSQERGDSVNLMNAPFAQEKITLPEVPLWKQPEVQELARSFAWPVGMLLLAVLVLFGIIRPALKSLGSPPQRRPQLDAMLSEEPERPLLAGPAAETAPAGPTPSERALDDARKLTRDNPAAVAGIVKGWVNGEGQGNALTMG